MSDLSAKGDRRRSTRIQTSIWVAIVGIDEGPVQRRGNISISGVYFEIDKPMGQPGSLCLLRLAASDGGPTVEVMSRLIRVVTCDDVWQGQSVVGVALEFIVHSEEQRVNIAQLIKSTATLQLRRVKALNMDLPVNAEIAEQTAARHSAVIRSLGQEGLILNTDWPVRVGETIRIAVQASESKNELSLVGRAVAVTEEPGAENVNFIIEVRLEGLRSTGGSEEAQKPLPKTVGLSISDAVEGLLDEVITARSPVPQIDPSSFLRGDLSQVGITGLLGFFELEKMTGRLTVIQDDEVVILYVRQGQLVDLEDPQHPLPPRQLLAKLLAAKEGRFEFAFGEVHREDRIQERISALLLQLAQERDEEHKEKAPKD